MFRVPPALLSPCTFQGPTTHNTAATMIAKEVERIADYEEMFSTDKGHARMVVLLGEAPDAPSQAPSEPN